MTKVGRNAPCPCGSKKKYKKCCGEPLKESTVNKIINSEEFSKKLSQMIEQNHAKELTRKQQQGLGKPIIAENFKGNRFVAVGNKLYYSPKWKTFADFLPDYLRNIMGKSWFEEQIQKPIEERHPLIAWHMGYSDLLKESAKPNKDIQSLDMTGVVRCYLGLAYSLYLLEHNVELQKIYIDRLNDINNFQGVYYELVVANCLIRAGFDLKLEDEQDHSTKHCEFSAISKTTGKKYWVEAKMRSVQGMLGKKERV